MPTPDLLAPASPAGAAARRPSLDAAAKDLARTARACWDGDADVVSEHVAGLAQMGLAASARRVKDHTIAQLLRPLRDEAPEVAGQLAAAIGTDTTLLHVAAARAHWEAVEALLPPQGAGRRPASAGSARGGSTDRCVDTLNDQRCTALLAAVLGGSQAPPEALLRVVGLLLAAGADANAPGVRTARQPAANAPPDAASQCCWVVVLLLQKRGVRPLHAAATNGLAEVCRALLAAGAAADAPFEGGGTALLLAAQWGHEGVARVLIEAGCDVMSSDGDGLTPLMAAAIGGHEQLAMLIMREAVAGRADQQ